MRMDEFLWLCMIQKTLSDRHLPQRITISIHSHIRCRLQVHCTGVGEILWHPVSNRRATPARTSHVKPTLVSLLAGALHGRGRVPVAVHQVEDAEQHLPGRLAAGVYTVQGAPSTLCSFAVIHPCCNYVCTRAA